MWRRPGVEPDVMYLCRYCASVAPRPPLDDVRVAGFEPAISSGRTESALTIQQHQHQSDRSDNITIIENVFAVNE